MSGDRAELERIQGAEQRFQEAEAAFFLAKKEMENAFQELQLAELGYFMKHRKRRP